jgi:AcrR family transcriptional regulator
MQERKVTVYITDALFELLKTKNLPDITTSEIIKKAGVCRSSFYRNFYLPEDVIRQYGVALFDEINRKLPIAQGGIREHIHFVNNQLWLHRERLTLLENRGLFYLLEGPIMEHCMLQIQRLGVPDNRYYTAYHAGATTQMIRAWIHNGFEESPQEITKLICELVKWELMGG